MILKRWTAGIISRVDTAVSRIENHDALVTAAIHEAHAARARATVQLGRVRADLEAMRKRAGDLRDAEARWKERAARVAGQDEERALECLRRRRRAERERVDLEKRVQEHGDAEKRLAQDLDRIAERIEQLRQQRNLLRTRQSRAEALAAAHDGGPILSDIDEILARWETKVTCRELEGGAGSGPGDAMEEAYAVEEERADLQAELNSMLRGTTGDTPSGDTH